MPDSVVCPSCKVRLKPQETHRGRTLRCPKCGQPVAIPALPPAPPSATPLPAPVDRPAPVDEPALPVIVTSGLAGPRAEPADAVGPPAATAPQPSDDRQSPVAVPDLDGSIVITTSGPKSPPRPTAPPASPAVPRLTRPRPRWLIPAGAGLVGLGLLVGAWAATRGDAKKPARRAAASRGGARAADPGGTAAAARRSAVPPVPVPAPALAIAPADTATWLPLPADVPGVAVRFPVAPTAIDPPGQVAGTQRDFAAAAATGVLGYRATAGDRTYTATITPREVGDATAEFHLERALANLDVLHPGFSCVAIYHPVPAADWRDALLDGAGRRRIVRLAQGADVAAALVVEGPADLAYGEPAVQGFFQSLSLPPAPTAVPAP